MAVIQTSTHCWNACFLGHHGNHELTKQTVKIQFFLTTSSGHPTDSGVFLTDADHESLLIQLAAAAPVKGEQGDRQINEALEIAERSPTLVLTTRNTLKMSERLSRTCTVIRTDHPFALTHQKHHVPMR